MNIISKNMDEKKETLVHIIAGQDAQKVHQQVEEFCALKLIDDIEKIWNATPVMVGVQQFGGGASANLQIILSCTIFWKCTKEQATTFRNQQKLLLKS